MARHPLTVFAAGTTVVWVLACSDQPTPVTGVIEGLATCQGADISDTSLEGVLDLENRCIDEVCVGDTVDVDYGGVFDADADCTSVEGLDVCEADGFSVIFAEDSDADEGQAVIAAFVLTDGYEGTASSGAGVDSTWQCFIDSLTEPEEIVLVPRDEGNHWISEMGWDEASDGTYDVWVLDTQGATEAEPDGYPDEIRLWSLVATPVLTGSDDTEDSTDTEAVTDTEETGQDTFDTAR